jgi:hypothetical protein
MTERITLPEPLPATAVVRVSRASYDPSRFAEVDAASKKTSQYIIPAIRRLPGLVDGRRDMEAVGVTFTPIFNYPIDWTWTV